MCYGVPILANDEKAVYGKGTSSHTTTCEQLKLNEDQWIKYEYHWWDKELVMDHYDTVGEDIIAGIDRRVAEKHAKDLVKRHFSTQKQVVEWLKDNKDEWGRVLEHGSPKMIAAISPVLSDWNKKIKTFRPSKKTNPYQATKLPTLRTLKSAIPVSVGDQVWAQVRDQVRDQVWAQVRAQVGDQVRAQVGDQVWDQVWAQVGATSYWAVKITLGLPIKHWFFDFLKLGVMIVFVNGKAKVFGKNGMYLGEYDQDELINEK